MLTLPLSGLCRRFVERPNTPLVSAPDGASQRSAIILLQRLLRGRAAQDRMYVGRARRLELIRELQLAETAKPAGRRPEDLSGAARRADALVGHAVSELCNVLVSSDAATRDRLLADLSARASAYQKSQQEAEAAAAKVSAGLGYHLQVSNASVAPVVHHYLCTVC